GVPGDHPDIPVKLYMIGNDIGSNAAIYPSYMHGGVGWMKPIVDGSQQGQFIDFFFYPHDQSGSFMNGADFFPDSAAMSCRTIDPRTHHTIAFLTDLRLHHRSFTNDGIAIFFLRGPFHMFDQ